MKELRGIFAYFGKYKFNLIVGIICIAASLLFDLTMPYLVGRAIDELREGVTWNKILFFPLAILAAKIVSGIFLFLQRRLIINMSRYVEYDLRRDFYSHIVHQPQSFFQKYRTGDLMARATNDMSAVRQIAGPMILYTFQAIFVISLSLPILLSISPFLTLLLFTTMPLVSLTVKYFGGQIHVRFEKIQEYFSGITARAQENLSGVRVVRAYAQEDAEIERFQTLNREYAERNLSLVKFSAAMRPLLQFFIGIGFVLIAAFGVPMAVRGEITAGQFVSFNLYLQRMIFPLIAFGYVVNLYQRGAASWKRLREIWSIAPVIKDAPEAATQKPISGAISFKNLNFAYNDAGANVLRDINLDIKAGQTVAFVGRTGSGKSTLVSLIPRLIDAPAETLFIDGVGIKKYPLEQLRRSIGFVQQETFLFSDSLADNIAFGIENQISPAQNLTSGNLESENADLSGAELVKAERRAVEKAAETAVLADDIKEFPHGYEQMVGERGITLSGGQKQRTAIARAVIRNPRILILDDALSAVDTYTEERILENLKSVRQNRTTLIVSHRVSTVRDADLICVLNEGRIVERGTHDELLKIGGEYAELYRRQLLEEEIAATA